MATSKITGYIINTKVYSNTTTIIEVLTEGKIVTIFGRGFKNPKNKFHVLNNRFIKLDLYGEENDSFFNLRDFDIIDLNDRFMQDYQLSMAMNMINQLLLQSNGLIDEQVFLLYEYTMKELSLSNIFHINCLWLMLYYQKLGKIASVRGCYHCQSADDLVTFDFKSGNYVCRNCYRDEDIFTIDELRYISNLVNFKIDKIINSQNFTKVYLIMYQQLVEEEGYYIPMWEEYARGIRSTIKR